MRMHRIVKRSRGLIGEVGCCIVLQQEGGTDMGKGKRIKAERKKQAAKKKSPDTSLLHPLLQKYPEDDPPHLRRVSAKSGEVLADPQEWVTLLKKPLDLHAGRDGITITVNGKFQLLAIPVFVRDLSYEKGSYDKYGLVKGAEKEFAVNETKTIHLGTLKFYQKIESENPLQKDQNEGQVQIGKDIILQFQDPESKDWLSLPHEGISIRYDKHGYIYSCSILEKEEGKDYLTPPHGYDTYTVFNSSPHKIALALGVDVGNHLLEKARKITGIPKIRVFYGRVEYMSHEEQSDLYRRAGALASYGKFREDLAAVFTKTPCYSRQKEFRFFITVDALSWDFESNCSLVVSMSPNLQSHFGYTYWAN